MVDIHSHILFDIDDGARNVAQSLELCKEASENGVKAIIATPHFYDYRKIESFVRERNIKANILRAELKNNDIPLAVATGAELFLSDDIFTAGNLDKLTLNNSHYMLCEFPLGPFDISRAPMWIDELCERGYTPILAHPERYVEFHRNFPVIDEILDCGTLFQVNIDSLLGRNGEDAQRMSTDMVERKIARFIATDAHDPDRRNTKLRERIELMPEAITKEMLLECMSRCPRTVLKNGDII